MTRNNVRLIVRHLGLVTTVALLAGCGPAYVKMTPETAAELRSAPAVHAVKFPTPAPHLMTPKSVAGGGLISSMTGSAELPTGGQLVKAYGLPDHAEAVSASLVEKLRTEGGIKNLRLEPGFLQYSYHEDTSRYRDKYPSGLVLELDIAGPGAGYGAMNWQTYTYGLVGKSRLIRVSDGKVLWSGVCALGLFGDEADKRKLDVTEFEKNGGKRFKEVYNYSNERCSRILADELLGKAS
jgi:hypothetical protein